DDTHGRYACQTLASEARRSRRIHRDVAWRGLSFSRVPDGEWGLNAGVRLKLFAISLALVVGVGLVCGVYLEHRLRSWLIDRIELELLGQARLARDLIETAPTLNDARVADELADRMGHSTGLRITIVGSDGVVLGDSSLSLAEVAQVEN